MCCTAACPVAWLSPGLGLISSGHLPSPHQDELAAEKRERLRALDAQQRQHFADEKLKLGRLAAIQHQQIGPVRAVAHGRGGGGGAVRCGGSAGEARAAQAAWTGEAGAAVATWAVLSAAVGEFQIHNPACMHLLPAPCVLTHSHLHSFPSAAAVAVPD